jgi:hypothetical protein
VIPTSELSPNDIGLLNAYPTSNTVNSGFNWQAAAPYPQNQRKDTFVVDYVPAEAHHLRFSILSQHLDQVSPFAGNFDRTPQVWDWPNQVGALHYTWTISPTMINDATFSASADRVTITDDLSSGLYNRTKYGINYPYLFSASDKLIQDKIPTINIANFTTFDGGPYPSHSGGVITNLADNRTSGAQPPNYFSNTVCDIASSSPSLLCGGTSLFSIRMRTIRHSPPRLTP